MSAPATAASGPLSLSQPYRRLASFVGAAAVIGWTILLSALSWTSAASVLQLGGYFGAKDARYEFAIATSVGAALITLAALAPAKTRTFPLAIAATACLAGAILALTSGSIGGVITSAMLLGWSACIGEACLRLLGLNPKQIGGWGPDRHVDCARSWGP